MYDIEKLLIERVNSLIKEFVERAWKCIFSQDQIINIDSLLAAAHTYLKCTEKIIETFPGIKQYLSKDIVDKLTKLSKLDIRETRFINVKELDINILDKKLDKIRKTSKWILRKLR